MGRYRNNKSYPFTAIVRSNVTQREFTIEFPTTKEVIKELFEKNLISSEDDYEVVSVEKFLYADNMYFNSDDSINDINYLAGLIDELEDYDYDKYRAMDEYLWASYGVVEAINRTQNTENYELYSNILNEEDLGRYYIDEVYYGEVPDFLKGFINYYDYGKYISENEDGCFSSEGYIYNNGGSQYSPYSGCVDDIPGEYIVVDDNAFFKNVLDDDFEIKESDSLERLLTV